MPRGKQDCSCIPLSLMHYCCETAGIADRSYNTGNFDMSRKARNHGSIDPNRAKAICPRDSPEGPIAVSGSA